MDGFSSFGEKFERLLETYRKPDGSRWNSGELARATGGFVTQPYLANLRAGRIRQPGFDRLRAISNAMGFPVVLWYEEPGNWERLANEHESLQGPPLADRLELLFDLVKNPRTGSPFTNGEVARLSLGHLDEREVEALRKGELIDPTMSQILALSDVFGVAVTYWYAPPEKRPPLDFETMEALRNEKTHLVLNKVHGRPDSEKDMILVLLEQLDRMSSSREDLGAEGSVGPHVDDE